MTLTRGVAILVAGLTMLTACGGEDADAMPNSPEQQPQTNGCADPATGGASALGAHLTADISRTDAGWSIRYDVTNGGDVPMYLVTLAADPPLVANYRPQNHFLVAGTDGVIEVSKREFFPPETCELPMMYAPPPPALAIRLDPGQSFGETLVVSEPLETRHPYGSHAISQLPPIPSEPSGMKFCVGVATAARPLAGPSFPKDREYFRFAAGDQQFLCSEVFAA
jgi:hypothetical protein